MKRIAVDLAKSVYQVAESVRFGQVSQRKRLSRAAFGQYIQEQAEPVDVPGPVVEQRARTAGTGLRIIGHGRTVPKRGLGYRGYQRFHRAVAVARTFPSQSSSTSATISASEAAVTTAIRSTSSCNGLGRR